MLFYWVFIHLCVFFQCKLTDSANNRLECCPSVKEFIQPKGGVSRYNRILELYHTNTTRQSFQQTSCRIGVRDTPCKCVLKNFLHSACVQKYSYVYAIVRDYGSPETTPWRMDLIRIRSGCSCEFQWNPKYDRYLPEYRTSWLS